MQDDSRGQTQRKDNRGCRHPEGERVPLTNGKGFHCGTCGANVHTEPGGVDETHTVCVSSGEPTERYKPIRQSAGKGAGWKVLDTVADKVVESEGQMKYRRCLERCKELNAKGIVLGTGVNAAIGEVPTVSLETRAAVEKAERQTRLQELNSLTRQAQEFKAGLGELRLKLNTTAAEFFFERKEQLVNVLDGFAHLRGNETIDGCRTATDWAKSIGTSYETLRRIRKRLEAAQPVGIGTPLLSECNEGNPQQGNPQPKSSAECRSDSARKAAETRRKNAAAKSGEENEKPEDKKPRAPQLLADTKPSFTISHSPVDDSETWAMEDAVRHIVSWTLHCLKGFALIEKRRIVEDVIGKLRDELAFEAPDASQAKRDKDVVTRVTVEGEESVTLQ